MDLSAHPCFDKQARLKYSRVHLPVAAQCNVQCNYCDRRFDCANESRPGVTSTLLEPEQAVPYLEDLLVRDPSIRVVGIAGPGDPLAAAPATLRTLELVRARYPEMLLCVATNGLALPEHAQALAELRVSHVTVTVNAVDPAVGALVYQWVRDGSSVLRGVEAGQRLWEAQRAGIEALVRLGVMVKINSVLVPGVNAHHMLDVAKTMAALGAARFNCLPLHPVPGTPFGAVPEPPKELVHSIRAACGEHLTQMEHCARCRADAVGRVGQAYSESDRELLRKHAEAAARSASEKIRSARRLQVLAPAPAAVRALVSLEPKADMPPRERPYVAVASHEGLLVNQHLGEASRVLVFGREGDQYVLIEERETPEAGSGAARWSWMAQVLADCRALLVTSVGSKPKERLQASGIEVLETDGLIEEALSALYEGRPLARPRPAESACGKGSDCSGRGLGCG